jgi:alpha-tubulin suppressor-like RCC1 family protein
MPAGSWATGTTVSSDTPVGVLLPAGAKVKGISASCADSYALTVKSHVLAWGDNGQGQLGDGSATNSDTPVRVDLPSGWRAAAVGAGPNAHHALAIVHKKS